jgi:hypothetical protein
MIQIRILYSQSFCIHESGSITKYNGSATLSKTKLGACTCTAAAASNFFTFVSAACKTAFSPRKGAGLLIHIFVTKNNGRNFQIKIIPI